MHAIQEGNEWRGRAKLKKSRENYKEKQGAETNEKHGKIGNLRSNEGIIE